MIFVNKTILEKLLSYSSGLYYTHITALEIYAIVNPKFTSFRDFVIWHDQLGHPDSVMMRRIIENSCGNYLKSSKILQSNEFSCAVCYQGK